MLVGFRARLRGRRKGFRWPFTFVSLAPAPRSAPSTASSSPTTAAPAGGRFLENIGTYDPAREPGQFAIDSERLAYWRSQGALPSATLDRLIKRQARAAAQPPGQVSPDG